MCSPPLYHRSIVGIFPRTGAEPGRNRLLPGKELVSSSWSSCGWRFGQTFPLGPVFERQPSVAGAAEKVGPRPPVLVTDPPNPDDRVFPATAATPAHEPDGPEHSRYLRG